MGYIEGYLTNVSISQNFYNMINYHPDNFTMPAYLKEYLTKNTEYMKKKAESKMERDKYWEHVYYIYMQSVGLYDGYIAAVGKNIIGFYEFSLLNAYTDMEDIISTNSVSFPYKFDEMSIDDIRLYTLSRSHCSALVKLAEDFSDIWFGHNTWFTYQSMLRIFKEYRFVTKNGYEKSKTTAFPSYPGLLFSSDDFYLLDSNLVVMETTNPIYNNDLFKNMQPECLLTWVRSMLANRLASSAEDWTKIFKKENSGTYNNQFMILDMNKISLKKKSIPDKSLMIIEQIPGETETNDVTDYLRKGYWPSYNLPFSDYFFEKCGLLDRLENNSKLIYDLDYNECSRAQIYRRDQGKIKTNDDFGKMLRYNDFQNDNLSFNQAYLTIAARYDLDPNKTYCYGATDVKYVSIKELFEGKSLIHIISGPSNDQLPTFSWSNATCKPYGAPNNSFEGLIDVWDKDWVEYKTQLFEIQKRDDEPESDTSTPSDTGNTTPEEKPSEDNNTLVIILSVVCGVLLIGLIIFIVLYVKIKKNYNDIGVPSGKIELLDK